MPRPCARRSRRPLGREIVAATPSDVTEEVTAWAVGGGILTVALFPLALPILLLTAAFVVPFVFAGIAIGLVSLVAAAPILLLRRARSRRRDRFTSKKKERT